MEMVLFETVYRWRKLMNLGVITWSRVATVLIIKESLKHGVWGSLCVPLPMPLEIQQLVKPGLVNT